MRHRLMRATRYVLPLLAALMCFAVQPSFAEEKSKPGRGAKRNNPTGRD